MACGLGLPNQRALPALSPAGPFGSAVELTIALAFLDLSLPDEAATILSVAICSRSVLAWLRPSRIEALSEVRCERRYLAWDGISPRI